MITISDINKLKTVFVTKEDAKKFATKDDVQDIIGGIQTVIEMLGEENVKNKEHNNILEHHERRLDKLEDKVFSAN